MPNDIQSLSTVSQSSQYLADDSEGPNGMRNSMYLISGMGRVARIREVSGINFSTSAVFSGWPEDHR